MCLYRPEVPYNTVAIEDMGRESEKLIMASLHLNKYATCQEAYLIHGRHRWLYNFTWPWVVHWLETLSLAILIKGKVHEALLKEDVIVIQGIIVKQVALKAG